MARLVMPKMRPLSRKEWATTLVVAGLILAYFIGLKVLDGRAESYFRTTRSTNPDLYLEQLRTGYGFSAFLPEYAALKGYEKSIAQPPEFLLGRWSMRSEALRLGPGESPASCSDPITFDYGVVVMREPESLVLHVDYAIADGAVLVSTDTGQKIAIKPESFGSTLEALRFTPPGRDTPVFAYRCEN